MLTSRSTLGASGPPKALNLNGQATLAFRQVAVHLPPRSSHILLPLINLTLLRPALGTLKN